MSTSAVLVATSLRSATRRPETQGGARNGSRSCRRKGSTSRRDASGAHRQCVRDKDGGGEKTVDFGRGI